MKRQKKDPPMQVLVQQEKAEASSFPFSEEQIEKRLNILKKIIDFFKGKIPIHSRLKPILDPDNLQTSSRLSASQVSFVADAFWLAREWDVFDPLKHYAEEICKTVISKDGEGRKEAIGFVGAIESKKLLERLIFETKIPERKSRWPSLRKKEKEMEGG